MVFTAATFNLDNFIVRLLCCHYTNHGGNRDDETIRIQEPYLRAEQVAAYLDLSAGNSNTGFLRITLAIENFASDHILLGAPPQGQLLPSQASLIPLNTRKLEQKSYPRFVCVPFEDALSGRYASVQG
ncbi:hypothetical protein [Massilia sp. DWR3-1-1]|uniref:hypothetical protein n=1 Tax=Massilia sp. DWR3-1-1 TaxID=2804559 RepID=UPI003CED28A9